MVHHIEVTTPDGSLQMWRTSVAPDLAQCRDLAAGSGPRSTWRAVSPDGQVMASGVVPSRQLAMLARLDEFVLELEAVHGAHDLRELAARDGIDAAMSVLAGRFPVLEGVPGTHPWDVDRLIAWLDAGGGARSALLAGRFLLAVWCGADRHQARLVADLVEDSTARRANALHEEYRRPFVMTEAWGCWDKHQRAAALSWLVDPWWP